MNLTADLPYSKDVLDLFELWEGATPGTRRRARLSKGFLAAWHKIARLLPILGLALLAATLLVLLDMPAASKTALLALLGFSALNLAASTGPAVRLVDSVALCCLEIAIPE